MRITIVLALISLLSLSWPAHADVSGRAVVIDGDTIEVRGNRIRLHGVDAPESTQTCLGDGQPWPCGQRASRALADRIAGRSVDCVETVRDRYGRIVAVCRLGGSDLSAWLVAEGWALANRRYSSAYVGQEATAKAARRGIWRGDFVAPWDWRAGVRLPQTRSADKGNGVRSNRDSLPDARECRIKGNVSRDGTRIYHVPGGKYYERTRIRPSKGERWFCSEAEARSAGWRKSRR